MDMSFVWTSLFVFLVVLFIYMQFAPVRGLANLKDEQFRNAMQENDRSLFLRKTGLLNSL